MLFGTFDDSAPPHTHFKTVILGRDHPFHSLLFIDSPVWWMMLLLLTKEYDAVDIDGDNEEDVSGNVGENLSHVKEGFWWWERVLSLELR